MKTYAIVASLFPPHVGGVERYSYNLAKKLTEQRIKTTLNTNEIISCSPLFFSISKIL